MPDDVANLLARCEEAAAALAAAERAVAIGATLDALTLDQANTYVHLLDRIVQSSCALRHGGVRRVTTLTATPHSAKKPSWL